MVEEGRRDLPLRNIRELRRADRREITRMGEQHDLCSEIE